MKKKRYLRQWIGLFIILIGWCILAWPFFTGWMGAKEQTGSYEMAQEEMAAGDTSAPSGNKKTSGDDADSSKSETSGADSDTSEINEFAHVQADELYQVCKAYNEELIADHQEKLVSTASTEQFAIDSTKYGFSEKVIGTIRIPRMDIQLALYLGADRSNMAMGAAIFGETSIPMSSGSANTAIAGHRGWRGTPMFRNIQQLQIGDPVYIETPWEGLVYRVTEIRIVLPEDNSWCMIEEGKNKISLMTCHPYRHHTHRYVVIAELTDEKIPSDETMKEEAESTFDASARKATKYDSDGTNTEVSVDPSTIEPNGIEYGAVWSNIFILAEDKMRYVMYGLAGLWILMLIWLIRRTRKG